MVEILQVNPNLPLPSYQTRYSAGMDLYASHDERLMPGERKLIKTGIAIALPADSEAQVRPRSGLALKHGITVLNTPGTIDADYRGEIGVILINLSLDSFNIAEGDRIAQLVITPIKKIDWQVVDNLTPTDRGEGGFGSTGV